MPGRVQLHVNVKSTVCPRCQLRQTIRDLRPRRYTSIRWSSTITAKSSDIPSYFPPPAEPNKPAYAHLSNRAVIRLHGPDVVDFLTGLLPARLQPLTKNNSTPIFTTFLSAKGRILHEAFIYPSTELNTDEPWHIDVDATSLSALFSHLKKHKLRSKFKLEKLPVEELSVYYKWPNHEDANKEVPQIGGQDPRPLMGVRFLSNVSTPSPMLSALQQTGSALSLDDYNIHRILCGHAEGPNELIPNSALPQESNIDFDGGIDFHKGCYLGQELTIRTHHTGVVRKRILPCQIYLRDQQIPDVQQVAMYDASISIHQPPSEANISKKHAKGRSGRSTGKWLGGVGNVGLALCRLEMMTDIQMTAEGTNFDPDGQFSVVWEDGEEDADGKTALREVNVKPFVPQWLRDNIQAGVEARSEKRKRRKQEDDDDEEEVD